jgi:hypothetical protein
LEALGAHSFRAQIPANPFETDPIQYPILMPISPVDKVSTSLLKLSKLWLGNIYCPAIKITKTFRHATT